MALERRNTHTRALRERPTIPMKRKGGKQTSNNDRERRSHNEAVESVVGITWLRRQGRKRGGTGKEERQRVGAVDGGHEGVD